VPVYVNALLEEELARLLNFARLIESAFSAAALEYRVTGGLAACLYIGQRGRFAGRLPDHIDILIRRSDLPGVVNACAKAGLVYREVAGVPMLFMENISIQLIFACEAAGEAGPYIGPYCDIKESRVVPLADVVRALAARFQPEDRMHLKDMDDVGLIGPEIEAALSVIHRERLAQVRFRA
jgi:hypothetical protein